MSARQVVPPAALAVALADAQSHARADIDENGASPLDSQILVQIAHWTEDAEHRTRRALILQTWSESLDSFPVEIRLPKSRLISVDHIKFYDTDGMQRTLDPQDYFVDSINEPGSVIPAPGRTWPATAVRKHAVEVQYKCGYGPDHNSVPGSVKGYILARIAEHFAPAGTPKSEHLVRALDRETVF